MEVGSLFAATRGNLDWLLSRLRTLVREGRKFSNFVSFCDTVRQLYWIGK